MILFGKVFMEVLYGIFVKRMNFSRLLRNYIGVWSIVLKATTSSSQRMEKKLETTILYKMHTLSILVNTLLKDKSLSQKSSFHSSACLYCLSWRLFLKQLILFLTVMLTIFLVSVEKQYVVTNLCFERRCQNICSNFCKCYNIAPQTY